MTKSTFIKNYRKQSGAEQYLIGFPYKGSVYMAIIKEIPPRYLQVGHASGNRGEKLGFYIHTEDKKALISKGAQILCKESDLEDRIGHLNKKGNLAFWNKGEMFEKLVTEFYGYEWQKDTVGYWKQGDIRINGIETQVKYQYATLTNSRILENLKKGA